MAYFVQGDADAVSDRRRAGADCFGGEVEAVQLQNEGYNFNGSRFSDEAAYGCGACIGRGGRGRPGGIRRDQHCAAAISTVSGAVNRRLEHGRWQLVACACRKMTSA